MTADEYQNFTDTVSVYPNAGKGTPDAWLYALLGIDNEFGEIVGKAKKFLRGDTICKENWADVTLENKLGLLFGTEDIKQELGDVMFYVARFARENGWTLSEIMETNKTKLASRARRGVLRGNGDNR